jgi:hypothetical protein
MIEVWIRGSHEELDRAARALAQLGPVVYAGQRQRLEPGRYATYARIAVHTEARPEPHPVT